MHIHTVEMNFEYRIKNIIKSLLQCNGETPKTGDELFELLWDKRKDLGELLFNDVVDWMSEEEWLEKVQS